MRALQSLHRRRAGTNTNSRVRMRVIQTNRPDQNRLRCSTASDDCAKHEIFAFETCGTQNLKN